MKHLVVLFVLTPILWAMQCNKVAVEPNPSCPVQVIISEDRFRNAPSDELTIKKAEIISDCLIIEFTAGGCDGSNWELNLYDANAIKESYPVQRDLRLSLKNTENCKALISQSVSFDLRPLQLEYDKILLNLTNSGDQLLYEY
jgi:hypothetical protein